jgi:hypothetical protein
MPQLSRYTPEDGAPIIDLVHVIFPEDIFVGPEQVLSWAYDALCDASVQDYVKANGLISPDADGDLIHAAIVRGVPRVMDLEEAKSILSDLGSHTFARR